MNIKATIIEHQQGSEAWVQHRSRSLNASELAAAMGLSPYMSRAELIKRKATGIVPEVDEATQRRFDKGHEVEAAARPLAEEIIGEELYASVFAAEVDGLHLSASLDGHTLLNEVTWEHKLAGADITASLREGVIPEQYHPQMEQGLMLTGAERCLFTASNGTRESAVHVWYESSHELRAKIIPTWKQFMADVAAYVPTAAEPVKPVGRSPDKLPALRSSVKGELVLESNIKEWETAALAYIKTVRDHELKTDEDFENADAAAKWCESSKTTLDGLKSNLMSATGDVNTAVGTLDRIMAELDKTRIQFTKAIAARKAERKAEIVAGGVAAYEKHEAELIRDTGGPWIVLGKPDFGGAIKNLRTFASIQNAVDTALAEAKIKADESARKIRESLRILAEDGAGFELLFHDRLALIGKAPDDLRLLVKSRIAEHQATERAKEEAQRERIRAEEAARLEREAKAEQREKERQAEIAAAALLVRQQADAAKVINPILAAAVIEQPFFDVAAVAANTGIGIISMSSESVHRIDPAAVIEDGRRLTLGQINERIAPVSITVAGLSLLGYEPVEQVKASRLYRASDFRRICADISAHVLAAPVSVNTKLREIAAEEGGE